MSRAITEYGLTNLSIKTVVLAAIVGLQVLAATIIISASYVSSGQAVLKQSKQLMVGGIEHTIRHTGDFLKPFETTVSVSKKLYESGVLNPADDQSVERYFFEQLAASPELSGMFHGDQDGNFVFVSRSSDVAGAGFRTKVVSRAEGRKGASLVYRNAGYERVSSRYDTEDAYDPRERPWYRDAMADQDVIWTDPYIFYTSKKPGITVAAPIRGQDGDYSGVIGIDVDIATLSGFLADLNISENSNALIMAANGDVIAHSHRKAVETPATANGSKPRFARVDESGDPVAQAAMLSLGSSDGTVDFATSRFTRVDVDGAVYNAIFEPVEVGSLQWVLGVYTPETDIMGQIVESRSRNIVIAVVITLIAILIGWAVSHLITRPMRTLSAMADRITRGDEPEAGAMPRSLAEVQDVSTALRRLTHWLTDYRTRNDALHDELKAWSQELEGRVEERTDALRYANDKLRLEISDRSEAERKLAIEMRQHRSTAQDLEIAFKQAEKASRAKSLFLSGMSHELRTPLNAIIGFSQMLQGQGGVIKEGQKAEYAGYILSSGERLLSLIDDVLDLAQVETGKPLLSIEVVNVRTVIDRVVAEAHLLSEEAGIELIDETRNLALPPIKADSRRMTQCLVNLVVNAIKYNRLGGTVRISAVPLLHSLRISVADTGIGIPQNRKAEVFESFNRLGAEDTAVQGTGIGLSLTKGFIEKMGGTLGFESVENEGSTFWLDLPLRVWQREDEVCTSRKGAIR